MPRYAYRGEIGALDVAAMRTMFDTNVFGLVDLTNRVVPEMKAQGEGDIVNIASTSGMKGAATATAYAGQQVGRARHQPVLAGGAAAARHSRDVRVSVGGADELRRPDRPQQSQQALRRRYRPTMHGGARHAAPGAVAGAGGVREQSVEGGLSQAWDKAGAMSLRTIVVCGLGRVGTVAARLLQEDGLARGGRRCAPSRAATSRSKRVTADLDLDDGARVRPWRLRRRPVLPAVSPQSPRRRRARMRSASTTSTSPRTWRRPGR